MVVTAVLQKESAGTWTVIVTLTRIVYLESVEPTIVTTLHSLHLTSKMTVA